LAVADKLRRLSGTDNVSIYYIGQKGDKNAQTIQRDSSIKRYSILAGKFRRYHSLSLIRQIFNVGPNLLNARDLLYIGIGFFQSLLLLIKIRPDIIFFKGGFVVVPIGSAARILGIPYITHDSDALPGLANRLIAKGARFNAVAHDGVTFYPKSKTVVTGIPVVNEYMDRQAVEQYEYKKRLAIPEGMTHLFIYTGTQGARVVDDALDAIIPHLLGRHKLLYVSHVFGRLNQHSMTSRYLGATDEQSKRIRKLVFIDNAFDYIASADIIIGRAGATSMAEFATVGRACIIVPAEQLTGGHQLKNVEPLESAEAIFVVREANIRQDLESATEKLITDRQLRAKLENNIHAFAVGDASTNIAQLILDTFKQHYKI
jgi:UDP-N-acetylglucosamine--N-acetylmuramyl-(pentapeptide) pyrophosphoryl-undecaprenol N-acetylglucosamine transferase